MPRRVLRRELLVATCAPTDAYDGNQAELTRRIIEMRLAYRDTSDYRRAQLTRLCAQTSRRGFYFSLSQRQTQQLRNDFFRKSSRGKRGGAIGAFARARRGGASGGRRRGGAVTRAPLPRAANARARDAGRAATVQFHSVAAVNSRPRRREGR